MVNITQTQALNAVQRNHYAQDTYSRSAPVVLDEVFPETASAIWIGGGGDLTLEGIDGVSHTFASLQAGTVFKFKCRRVLTGTTCTLMNWLGGES